MKSFHCLNSDNQLSQILQSHNHSIINYSTLIIIYLLINLNISSSLIIAQPSGGPYGPVALNYELPKDASKIYYVASDGKSDQSGESLTKPTTIESAIEKVKTGDAIIMRGGIYRTGNLILNQGITIQPYADEQPVLKGTYVADKWQNLGNGLWTTKWDHLFPSKPDNWWQRNREGKKTPLYRFNNDMVFVDGKFLQAVGWEGEVDENTYYIDYENGLVYIGIDPTNHLIEITAFNVALLRTTKDVNGKTTDHRGPTVRGITFTQYAFRAIEIEGTEPEGISPEADHGKEVVGSTFENCTISFCSRVAGYFRGDHLTMSHCKITDTSTEGVYIIASADVLLEKNIFTRNNIERITGYYPAAVKIFNQSYRVTCNDNLVIDLPFSNGIWYDVGNVDGTFINNWVEGVGNNNNDFSIDQPWPSDNGFFFEISKGAVCAGNVFVNCDHGIWVLNSSNVHIYNNTFVNSIACISRNGRSAAGDHFGWHPSTGPDVEKREGHIFENNLLTCDGNFKRPLLYVWQPSDLCNRLPNPQLKELDYNAYARGLGTSNNPLIWWSPVKNEKCRLSFTSLDEFQKSNPQFETHSKYYSNFSGLLFKGAELGNYQLLQAFPGSNLGTQIPSDVSKLIGHTKNYVGAFPPVQ
jgi:parallel beta-helix repeat protein